MNITLRSKIDGNFKENFDRFDQDLFLYLLPPGAQLIEFGGSKTGDIVHLKLPLAGEWISDITEHGHSEDRCYFIDEGRKLFVWKFLSFTLSSAWYFQQTDHLPGGNHHC